MDPIRLAALRELSEWEIEGPLRGSKVCDLILTDQSFHSPLDFSGATVHRPYMQRIKGQEPSAPARASFSEAIIENGRFLGAVLTEANFKKCTLGSTDRLRGTSFQGAMLERADFSDCTLNSVNFSDTILTDADFTGARILGQTDFSNANLNGVSFVNARIENPKFDGADLTNTDFRSSTVELVKDSRNTTWWLALWSEPLDPSMYNKSEASKGSLFIKKSIELNLKIEQATLISESYPRLLPGPVSSANLATALNELAWHQAVYGLDLRRR